MREECQGVRILWSERERLGQGLLRVGETALAHVDGTEVGIDTRIAGGKPPRFVQTCLGGGEVARLQLPKRAPHPIGRGGCERTVAVLVTLAAAAGTRRIARG